MQFLGSSVDARGRRPAPPRQEVKGTMGLGWQELLIVLIIVMIIFGAGKLTDVGRSLGRGIKEFKAEASGKEPDAAVAADIGGKDEGRGIDTRGLRAHRI